MSVDEVQPYDWSAVYDDEGKIYYYNAKTDETTWDAPDRFNPPEEDPPAKTPGGTWEKLTTDDGEVYYYNAATEVTTWEKPDGFDDGDIQEKEAVVKDEWQTDPIARPTSPANSQCGEIAAVKDANKATHAWEKHETEEGEVFYYNTETEETTWEIPEGFQDGTRLEKADDEKEVPPEEETLPRSPVIGSDEEEKEGDDVDTKHLGEWERHKDSEGLEYYYNPKTEETTRERPPSFNEMYDDDEGNDKVAEPEDNNIQESQGRGTWEKLIDAEGNEYYYNSVTQKTQWDKPDGFQEGDNKGQWQKFEDEEGNTYYYNETTGETQWEPPIGFVDQDEKRTDGDDEFQASPTRSPSPPASGDEEPEQEPELEPKLEPEPEPEIDPAVKRVMDAEEALNKPDSVLEPGCTANVLEVVASQDGNPEKAIVALIDNFHGQTAICGILSKWLADLRSASTNNSDVNELVGTAKHSVADGIRETAQDVIALIAKERFSNKSGDSILDLSKSEAAFLEDMIDSTRWRKLLIDLSASNKESALLMYCIRTISKKGYHRELVKRMNPSEYFSVFNSMLQSELTIVGKTAISASNDVDTSIGLEELVADLHRTCTATAFTYLYSIEMLRHLVSEAEKDSEATPGSRMRRAIRKWERLSEDLDTAMVDPNTSSSTAGSSSVFRKRRLDVALTISELHQRQRRRFKPSAEQQEAPGSNGNEQTKKLESGLEQFLRRYSVGTSVDEKILDTLVPTGLNMQAASEEVGNLLVSYPLSIRALLSNIFKTGAPIADGVRTKCANLIALAILATEKKARAEIGERSVEDPEAPDAVALQSTIKAASKLCEELATMASFVVTSSGKERGSLASPAQQLCNIALKCPAVAQGVLMWANDITKAAEFTSSATYSTFAVSILSLVRIVALKHPCCRKEAAGIAFTFLKHNTSSEISYKKINDIKEQSLRLLLFLIVHGECPSVLRTMTSLLMQGDAIKMDASLMRYLISGIIDVIRPPFSIPFVRLLGAVLKTPRCIDAVRSKYFGEAKRNRLVALLADFKRALFTTSQGKATSGDVALVAFLIKTYRTS